MSENKSDSRKVALITGGSRGLGSQICSKFAAEGFHVIINFNKSESEARKVLQEIKHNHGSGEIYQCDVSDFAQVKQMSEDIAKTHDSLSVVVNNAGITQDSMLVNMEKEQWDEVIAVNLNGTFNVCRNIAPLLVKKMEGCIINISSISGIEGRAGQANYSASKSGIIAFSKSLAEEIGRFNIKVNVVVPGFMHTEMTTSVSEKKRHEILKRNVLPSRITTEETAEFIFYLSQQKNISGQVFHIDSRILG